MAALNLPALDDFQPWMKWLGVAAILIPSLFAVFIAMGVGKKPQRSSDWWRLRDAILDITISYQPIIRLKTVSTIPAVSRAGLGFRRRIGNGLALATSRGLASLRQELEPQRAGDGSRFYQTDVDDVPQPVHGTAARADQRVARLVVVEIF